MAEGMKLNWVTLRYRTKRGAKQKVKLVDMYGQVDKTIASLKSTGCHSFTTEDIRHA